MARPKTKEELIKAATLNYEILWEVVFGLTEQEMKIPFDFSQDLKKKEAKWKRDKNLRDIFVHLYKWHQLLLDWVESNQQGKSTTFIPQPYSWKTYGNMNIEFWKKGQTIPLETAKETFVKTHQNVMSLLDKFSDEELFTKGIFIWVGGSTLGSYFISVTASHYDWAVKKLKAHKKYVHNNKLNQ